MPIRLHNVSSAWSWPGRISRNLLLIGLFAGLNACDGGTANVENSQGTGFGIPTTPVSLVNKSDVERELGNALNVFRTFDPTQPSLSPGENAPFQMASLLAFEQERSSLYGAKTDVMCPQGGADTHSDESSNHDYSYFGIVGNLSDSAKNIYSKCKRDLGNSTSQSLDGVEEDGASSDQSSDWYEYLNAGNAMDSSSYVVQNISIDSNNNQTTMTYSLRGLLQR